MKVSNDQQAPDFSIKDIDGKTISLKQFAGQKIHLNFYRFSGCPICNLRFHEIEKQAGLYKKNNVKLISIYESSAENMKSQMYGETVYADMIPDENSSLYKLYDLDRSVWGLINFLLFKGGLKKVIAGQKLFKQKVKQDGHTDRLEAEFLIDTQGKVVLAHYNKFAGDYLPFEIIKAFIESK